MAAIVGLRHMRRGRAGNRVDVREDRRGRADRGALPRSGLLAGTGAEGVEVEAEGKLSAGEIATLRKTVTAAYLSQATPEEIAVECLRVLGGKKP